MKLNHHINGRRRTALWAHEYKITGDLGPPTRRYDVGKQIGSGIQAVFGNIHKDDLFNKQLAVLTMINLKMEQLDQLLVEQRVLGHRAIKLGNELENLIGKAEKNKEKLDKGGVDGNV